MDALGMTGPPPGAAPSALWLAHPVIVADQAGGVPPDAGTDILAAVPPVLFAIGLVGTLVAHRRVRAA